MAFPAHGFSLAQTWLSLSISKKELIGGRFLFNSGSVDLPFKQAQMIKYNFKIFLLLIKNIVRILKIVFSFIAIQRECLL